MQIKAKKVNPEIEIVSMKSYFFFKEKKTIP